MRELRARALAALLFVLFTVNCSEDSTAPPPPDEPPAPDAVGSIRTWAGTGHAGYNGEGQQRLQAEFYWPVDIEFTPTLGTFVVDWNNHRIRRFDASGGLQTVVGTPSIGDGPPPPNVGADAVPPGVDGTVCDLNHPTQVFERSNGKLVVVCWHNHKLREWDPATGKVVILMGRGAGCSGDGAAASAPSSLLNQVAHAIEAPDGSFYINDQRNQCIRKIDPAGNVSTVVSVPQCNTAPGSFVDNVAPSVARLSMPTGGNPNPPGGGLALDAQGRLYIADTLNHRIRRVDFGADLVTTVVGNGAAAFAGDGGDPLLASLNTPLDITFGPDDRLYIADTYNNRVRAVDFGANVITTVAGNGTRGFSGDGKAATEARLNQPYGVAFDADGHLFIADTYNHRIRRVLMHD
jgi:sugar lactone lactonase YvrE